VDNQIHPIRAYDGKVIGTSDGKTFRKTIKGSSHLLRCPPAIAIDAQAYTEQISPTHEAIEVTDIESGTVYSISIESFERNKESLNYGYGEQFYVRLRYWDCEFKNGVKQLPLW
jgi:hypothetical protein